MVIVGAICANKVEKQPPAARHFSDGQKFFADEKVGLLARKTRRNSGSEFFHALQKRHEPESVQHLFAELALR